MTVDYTLYGITDSKWTNNRTLEEAVEEAILGGITLLQYREKHLASEEKKLEAIKLRDICRNHQVPFIINDDVNLAKEIDADGVHLGQDDMNPNAAREILGPNAIIGVTARSVEQAIIAQKQGADYLGSGAVFGTSTKGDAKPMELDVLDLICESVSIPVVAIGGIALSNIERLRGRKMSGFAIVSGIFNNRDIAGATRELKEKAIDIIK